MGVIARMAVLAMAGRGVDARLLLDEVGIASSLRSPCAPDS